MRIRTEAARRILPSMCVLVALVSPIAAAGAAPAEVPVGGTLHDVRLHGLNGPARPLSSFRGKPLIINVWASWCGPCRSEMASLERLAWRDDSHRFAIIGVSTDDYIDKARAWLNDSNATISQFIDANLEMETMLGASRLPLTVLVDANGRVLDKVYGAREWDSPEALRLISQAFGGGAKPAKGQPK